MASFSPSVSPSSNSARLPALSVDLPPTTTASYLHPSLSHRHSLTIQNDINTVNSPSSPRPSSRVSTHSRPTSTRDYPHSSSHRHHPYRASSRNSTASSSADGEGDEEPPHSDYDYATSSSVMGDRRESIELLARSNSLNEGRAGRELGRADSFRSTGGGRASTRTAGSSAYEERYSGQPIPPSSNYAQTLSSTLSSPATSSPTFSFARSDATGGRTYPHPHSHSSSPTASYSPSSSSHQQQASSPLSLDSLPSYPSDQKPPFSYPVLIRLAILGSPQKRLLLSQIYAAIEEKFPWYKESAPKAWKASVRHCLSLNKEFVRMQRAVEDPGVGCGGWWSVSEGTKGLKRPRKRRPVQTKRGDYLDVDDDGYNDAPRESMSDHLTSESEPQRRHSLTTQPEPPLYLPSGASTSNSIYTQSGSAPLSSSSVPPPPSRPVPGPPVSDYGQRRPSWTLPPIEDYSLRLPPILVPEASRVLPTPPESAYTVLPTGHRSGSYGHHPSLDSRHRGSYDPRGSSSSSSYKRAESSNQRNTYQRDHSHTPTASTSSSYSTNSQSGFSERSAASLSSGASDGKRDNPMSISSLLNNQLRLPVDPEDDGPRGQQTQEQPRMDVDQTENVGNEAQDEIMANFTPFSSEQTIRPASSRKHSPPPPTRTVARDVDIRSRTPHYAPSHQAETSRNGKKSQSRWTRKKATDQDSE